MAEELMTKESFSQNNEGYTNAGAIHIRLDTSPLLDSIEAFLRGSQLLGYKAKADGSYEKVFGKSGTALMNDLGIQNVMNMVRLWINPHVVQGNTTAEMWEDFQCRKEMALSTALMTNLVAWEIADSNYQPICDAITECIADFSTRTIDNKERESYGPTMRTVEHLGQGGGSSDKGMLRNWIGGGR